MSRFHDSNDEKETDLKNASKCKNTSLSTGVNSCFLVTRSFFIRTRYFFSSPIKVGSEARYSYKLGSYKKECICYSLLPRAIRCKLVIRHLFKHVLL